MNHPTDHAAPRQTIDDLIAEAAGATKVLPPHQRCVELDEQLRGAIRDLYQAAAEQAGTYPERSRDWYRITNVLEQTDMVLGGSLGTGLLSAALQVAALGRQARALIECVGDER